MGGSALAALFGSALHHILILASHMQHLGLPNVLTNLR